MLRDKLNRLIRRTKGYSKSEDMLRDSIVLVCLQQARICHSSTYREYRDRCYLYTTGAGLYNSPRQSVSLDVEDVL